MKELSAFALITLSLCRFSASWPVSECFLNLKSSPLLQTSNPTRTRAITSLQCMFSQAPASQWRPSRRQEATDMPLKLAKNRWSGKFEDLSASQSDLTKFRDILRGIQSANETEYPSIVGSNVEFLLRTDLQRLSNMIQSEEMDETSRARHEQSFQLVLDFLEVFVNEIKQIWDDNR